MLTAVITDVFVDINFVLRLMNFLVYFDVCVLCILEIDEEALLHQFINICT